RAGGGRGCGGVGGRRGGRKVLAGRKVGSIRLHRKRPPGSIRPVVPRRASTNASVDRRWHAGSLVWRRDGDLLRGTGRQDDDGVDRARRCVADSKTAGGAVP